MPIQPPLFQDYIEAQLIPIESLYERYQTSVLQDIARRLAAMGKITDTAAWQMQRLVESGAVYDHALNELAKLTNLTEVELKKLFTNAGVTYQEYTNEYLRQTGAGDKVRLNLSPAMDLVMQENMRKTQGTLKNLTGTTAITAESTFKDAADLAYQQVSTGTMSWQEATQAAIKDAAAKGLTTINYESGHRDSLDVALRRTILTGVSQTAGKIQERYAKELGTDLVEVSAHQGARNTGAGPMNHAAWQGKVYSLSGANPDYPPLVETTGYGTGPGLYGWNCRHDMFPFFEGISLQAYSEKAVKNYNKATVKMYGNQVDQYTAHQEQRRIERTIRKYRRQASCLQAAGYDPGDAVGKIAEWQSRLNSFVKETGLDRQPWREQAFDVKKPGKPKPPIPAPKPKPIPAPAPAPVPIPAPPPPPPPAPKPEPKPKPGYAWKGIENIKKKVDWIDPGKEPDPEALELRRKYAHDYGGEADFMDESLMAKTKNTPERTFYHVSREGFVTEQGELQNNIGKALYAGKDPKALLTFYGEYTGEDGYKAYKFEVDQNASWSVLDIRKPSDKYNIEKQAKKEFPQAKYPIQDYAKAHGYDALVYFDPWATGEEWAIYSQDKLTLQGELKAKPIKLQKPEPKPKPENKQEPKLTKLQNAIATQTFTTQRNRQRGAFESEWVTFEDGTEALRKPDPVRGRFESYLDERTMSRREAKVYDMDQKLGLNIVPECRYDKKTRASYMVKAQGAKTAEEYAKGLPNYKPYSSLKFEAKDQEGLGKMLLLDLLTGNTDRHDQNWMIGKSGKIIAIDNGLSFLTFGTEKQMDSAWRNVFPYLTVKPNFANKAVIPETTKSAFQDAYKSGWFKDFYKQAQKEGVLNQYEVDKAMERLETIVKKWDNYFE